MSCEHTPTVNAVRVGCVLQHLPPEAPQMFVTLNPPHPPAADKVIRRLQLAHPVYRYVATASTVDSARHAHMFGSYTHYYRLTALLTWQLLVWPVLGIGPC